MWLRVVLLWIVCMLCLVKPIVPRLAENNNNNNNNNDPGERQTSTSYGELIYADVYA